MAWWRIGKMDDTVCPCGEKMELWNDTGTNFFSLECPDEACTKVPELCVDLDKKESLYDLKLRFKGFAYGGLHE